jgi:hypothetical protein
MNSPLRLPFSPVASALGEAGFSPLLPIVLSTNSKSIEAAGLLDTGATVNVLPWHLGLSLGLDWDAQHIPLQLTGNLANYAAKAVLLQQKWATLTP